MRNAAAAKRMRARPNPPGNIPPLPPRREASVGPPAISLEDRRALLRATFALSRQSPELSARFRLWPWQKLTLIVVFGLLFGSLPIAPAATIAGLTALTTVGFIGVVAIRLAAIVAMVPRPGRSAPRLPDDLLPTYTVLVPMFDEAEVLATLVSNLEQLDYPAHKLEILLVLEQADQRTQAALAHILLPPHMRAIIVPDGQPRTKPKATNYALQFARGDFVVVYDAEDRPEPDQLRRAAAAFAAGRETLACVQARLNIFNPHDSWFSRHFTVEYCVLFDAILPVLAMLRLPVPLGGTSNHFRRQLLVRVGAWDPFNVTEDADLGVRLARQGYTTDVLSSTTWEEAPVTFAQWLPQRTRWLKGWYQTYAVHTRRPAALIRELGLWRALGFNLFLGGLLLSTLLHPAMYVLIAWQALAPDSLALPDLFGSAVMWSIAVATIAVGYLASIAVGLLAAHRRGHGLLWTALHSPICWLLVSAASYRAVWQLWRQPFLWEKTAHGQAKRKIELQKIERADV